MSRNDTSAGEGPDFANSSRFQSAPFQRQPVNRSTGPRFHPAPLHRLKPSKTGCPGALSAEAFAKSHQPASRASGPCRNFRPHDAPNFSPSSAAPGKLLALRLPACQQATDPFTPARQKNTTTPFPDPLPGFTASPFSGFFSQKIPAKFACNWSLDLVQSTRYQVYLCEQNAKTDLGFGCCPTQNW